MTGSGPLLGEDRPDPDDDVMRLAMGACAATRDAAVAERLTLLHAGLGTSHAVCVELDNTARAWAQRWDWYRHRLVKAPNQGALP